MTTFAAILGALPLMLGTGAGSELRNPLGVAIVGGLDREPGLDAFHDAGDLPLFRSSWRVRFAARAPPEIRPLAAGETKDEPLRPLHRASGGDNAPRPSVLRWRGALLF